MALLRIGRAIEKRCCALIWRQICEPKRSFRRENQERPAFQISTLRIDLHITPVCLQVTTFTQTARMKDSANGAAAVDAQPTESVLPAKRELEPKPTEVPAKRECPPPTPSEPALKVLKLHEKAKLPKRGSALSAGYDLAAGEETVVPAKGRAVVKTGLKIQVPTGCYGRVAPRSGLAVKNFIDTGAGVVDADYRGELGVVLFNFSEEEFKVNVGDRIAQLIIEKVCMGPVEEVKELDETERGEGGFGSTGVEAKA
ncbi:Deoxyuridine 5'-triphosphate nucleotidohydrolase [Gracilariopsis chorda]|uniref:Deoxyuridine 5'-triphosphate nucleotidohydrolase n=1 Tax=Gracilariopsis chorda TaxID=448386 RepID=A0A2V3IGP8_9FLOR|nr:Deoxyuridine 5'-triphosphate nucleotidohydrolase [Gracilariopsis chorda]|eukprot:PXF40320.1 Deoxyuridine 5'-triphosphate nucleotidohydrolase [Gracilariopsis chorda]